MKTIVAGNRDAIKQIVKQSSIKYSQKEIEDAIKGHILRFNNWVNEFSEKYETELKQILNEAYSEIIGELK